MQSNQITQTEFESMFGTIPQGQEKPTDSGFSFSNEDSIFKSKPVEDKPEDKVEPIVQEEVVTKEEVKETEEKEDSLFKQEEKPAETTPLTGLKDYFESRIKEGKFLPFEDGKLESPEDIDALIEANFSHKIEEIKDQVRSTAYSSMTPAWRFVAESASKFSNPADLIPLLQGVQNIDTVSQLNPENEAEAEAIIRTALRRRNEPAEIIEDQIALMKEGKALSSTAKKYQPILINEENQKMAAIQRQKAIEEQKGLELVSAIHEKAVENLETPFLGKHKLRQEEKQAIYDLIAEPQGPTGGYKIFEAIDNLYEKQDFETLREIALILSNKDSHRKYMGVSIGSQVGERLLRTLKTTQTATTSFENEEPAKARLPKPKAPTQGSGFGFFSK